MSILFHVRNPGIGGIDSYTELMLHGDESPLVDSGLTPKILTLNGGIARSATESKFGGYSTYFNNGSSQYISVADDAGLNFGSGDFTIDWWQYLSSTSGYRCIMSKTNSGSGYGAIQIQYHNPADEMQALFSSNTGGWQALVVDASPPANQWVHYAVVRNGTSIKMYRDGTETDEFITSISLEASAYPLLIGRQAWPADPIYFHGYVDELRISKGEARWTTGFTPESGPYTE